MLRGQRKRPLDEVASPIRDEITSPTALEGPTTPSAQVSLLGYMPFPYTHGPDVGIAAIACTDGPMSGVEYSQMPGKFTRHFVDTRLYQDRDSFVVVTLALKASQTPTLYVTMTDVVPSFEIAGCSLGAAAYCAIHGIVSLYAVITGGVQISGLEPVPLITPVENVGQKVAALVAAGFFPIFPFANRQEVDAVGIGYATWSSMDFNQGGDGGSYKGFAASSVAEVVAALRSQGIPYDALVPV